ncbi:MAG: O-antigen ligase family protein [Candidatus Tantalella remota]|nr:O-antigen ligase family protein [Candidatus Tantalella remota]
MNFKKDNIIRFCLVIIEWSFYVLLVGVTFSTSLVEIMATVMIVAWILKKCLDRDIKVLDSVPVRILGLFILWTMLSCVNSEYFKESFRGIFKWLEYAALFLITATELRKKRVMKGMVGAVILATIITTLNGIYQYFNGIDLIRHRSLISLDSARRISSSFVHPNDYGAYLLVVSVLFISFIIARDNRLRNRIMALVPAGLALGCLFFTRSRGAWISFAAAFLMVGAIRAKKLLAVFIVLLVIVFVMMPYTVQNKLYDLADFQGGTTWERLMLWKGTINMIKVHPVLGFGVNTYSRNFPVYKPADYPDVRYSHNCYLHMASEIGIVGALIFLTFLVTVLVLCLKGMNRMESGKRKTLAQGIFAGVFGFALNSVVDTHLYSVNLAVFFNLLLGYGFALACYAQED